ncbi:MAG: paraquat-inducible protein A [Bdellovibrionales bacterium]|nr:paraquat-inducible protein A [Bdellovibrionales bacterium]
MKHVKLAVSIIIFFSISFLGYQMITGSMKNQKFKRDYAEINHFKYGLFSVDAWKEQLTVIITDEIDKLYLTRKNKDTLKDHLETQLGVLIDKVFERIRKNNKGSPLKQSIMDEFLKVDEVKQGIPEYAQAILKEMSKSKSENQIKGMLKDKIEHYVRETFDTKDATLKQIIIAESGMEDEDGARKKIKEVLLRNHEVISEQALIIIVLAIVLFIFEGLTKGPLLPSHYFILTATLLVMMIVGVTTPMIDMEAKISNLSFVLFDHPIVFRDQVLYFQSKSILDVFWVMITHKEIQMKLVGVLVIGFSIVFPLFKMASSLLYYYDYCRARKYRIIRFFVEQSGKWSMADVLVVAIFMSYIGFNGIINSQLGNLGESTPNLELITTNGTNLQPGYYLFLAYTVLAMFLSLFLKNRPYICEDKVDAGA